MARNLNIVHIAAECSPFSKSGGLGDVVSALPKSLSQLGYNVSIFLPFHGITKKQHLETETVLETEIVIARKRHIASLKKLKTEHGVTVFFVCNEALFGKRAGLYGYEDDGLRFAFFDVAVLTFLNQMTGKQMSPFTEGKVDIIHCHDWHAGLVPQLLCQTKRFPALTETATLFTIHNLAFQGPNDWWAVPASKLDNGRGEPLSTGQHPKHLNFTRRAIMQADAINTVSERYAAEILTPEFGQGLDKVIKSRQDRVFGIINGVDYAVFNPQFDPYIYDQYDTNSIDRKILNKIKLQAEVGLKVAGDIPMIGMVNRLTEHKGFELVRQLMPTLLKQPLQLIVVGSGDKEYIKYFRGVAKKYPQKIAVHSPFTQEMASKVYAGSDMYLMPSRFEPCGISQLISLRYGSVPIVHETGGLHDTISNYNPANGEGNGFAFSTYTKEDFLVSIVRALETYNYKNVWHELVKNGMHESFSWDLPAKKYAQLYQVALKNKRLTATHHKKTLSIILSN